MSAILDQLTALLATASPTDAVVGASIRDALAAAEADFASASSFQASEQEAYRQASAAFITDRLAAFNAGNRTARAVEQVLPQRGDREPDVSVPAEFNPADGVATVTLLGIVRVTALERGAYGSLIEAAVLPSGAGFACTIRRGVTFSETVLIGDAPTTGLIAKVQKIAPGSLSTTAFEALAGGSGGGIDSLVNRLSRAKRIANADFGAVIDSALASLKMSPPQPPQQRAQSLPLSGEARSAALKRAQDFIEYLEVV